MDDVTALWLLSALLQSMATIWALFLALLLFYLPRLTEISLTTTVDNITSKRITKKLGTKLVNNFIILNSTLGVSIFFCIIGFITFRNDIVIGLSLVLSGISIYLVGHIVFDILRTMKTIIKEL